ncbi:uridine kinase [Methylobacterium durans]|uniref:uridine kinase n=1 Tax=Methylobacterium durans TaxID=2202825 RepID=UPI002AFFEEAD|nr:uridine kinase [Methylobacterium durans]MEA1831390.1 uridine kinase [Methylobacterium durans]
MSGPAFVVAVAGPPGSGKTSLTEALSRHLGGAPIVSYDAYERITDWPPDRVADWLRRGAPLAEVPLPGLATDLAALRRGEAVPDRARGGTLRLGRAEPRIALFDTLLGRAHAGTGAFIDLLIWLDVPLDVALARKLRSFTAEALRDPRAGPPLLAALDAYLGRYETLLRPTYAIQRERVRPGADLVLPAAPLADLLTAALPALARAMPRAAAEIPR